MKIQIQKGSNSTLRIFQGFFFLRVKRELTPAEPTVPSTIDEEKLINPFMRVSFQNSVV